LLDNDIKDKGEYQITNALENMKNKGLNFTPGKVTEWLDCGNKDSTVNTNQRYLEYIKDTPLVAASAKLENSVLIHPVYIGEGAVIKNSIVGPHVSIGNKTVVEGTIISNSIVQENASLKNANITNSMLGNFATFEGSSVDLSVGDYNVFKA